MKVVVLGSITAIILFFIFFKRESSPSFSTASSAKKQQKWIPMSTPKLPDAKALAGSKPKKEKLKYIQDEEFSSLLANAQFEDAAKHIIKKSEQHIDPHGQITKDHFIQKLNIMDEYIEHDPTILKRSFGLAFNYYTLNAFTQREQKLKKVFEVLKESHKQSLESSPYCVEFFQVSGRVNINFNQLSDVVFECAKDPNKRSIVHDYINLLKDKKGENEAMQEYTKLRLLYNELPEYGSF